MAETIRVNSAGAADARRASAASVSPSRGASTFAEALEQARGVRFSSHAQKRLEVRDIRLNDNNLARLAAAVDRVAQRGGKESLVLMDDLAFIVNVKDRLVVTAMDGASQKEGIFTQIDSVVLAHEK